MQHKLVFIETQVGGWVGGRVSCALWRRRCKRGEAVVHAGEHVWWTCVSACMHASRAWVASFGPCAWHAHVACMPLTPGTLPRLAPSCRRRMLLRPL